MKSSEQIRDEVAEMLGHKPTEMVGHWMQRTEKGFIIRPIYEIIPTTVDGIAALWPKGWGFETSSSNWWTDMTGGNNHVNAIMYQVVAHKHSEKYEDADGHVIVGEPNLVWYDAFLRTLHAVLLFIKENPIEGAPITNGGDK